jgi:dTDP-4-dehydrorhamnose reductase
MSFLLFGASGYIGEAFVAELNRRELTWERLPHTSGFMAVADAMMRLPPKSLVINCAAFIPTPSVDACKNHKGQTILGNVVFPGMLTYAAVLTGTALAHIGTACLYGSAREYSETDAPTRDFEGYCGFYLKTKYLAEQLVRVYPNTYVWRIRLPFDEIDHPKNYLTKLQAHKEVWAHDNSLTHRGDFVKAALDMWKLQAPFGVYNMVNPGSVNATDILRKMDLPAKRISLGPVTGSRLSAAKLLATGVKMRNVHVALNDAMINWRKPNVS